MPARVARTAIGRSAARRCRTHRREGSRQPDVPSALDKHRPLHPPMATAARRRYLSVGSDDETTSCNPPVCFREMPARSLNRARFGHRNKVPFLHGLIHFIYGCPMQEDQAARRIKLRQLEVLVAIAECGTMGKAAERLALTQPVISKAIADLE